MKPGTLWTIDDRRSLGLGTPRLMSLSANLARRSRCRHCVLPRAAGRCLLRLSAGRHQEVRLAAGHGLIAQRYARAPLSASRIKDRPWRWLVLVRPVCLVPSILDPSVPQILINKELVLPLRSTSLVRWQARSE